MSDSGDRRHWLALVGCFTGAVGFFAFLLGPSSLIPVLIEDFGVDKPTAGLSISVVFLAWVLFQLPGGVLVDRYDNRLLVGAGGCLLVVAAGAGMVVSSYLALLVTRFVGGLSAVFLWTAGVNVVSRTFPRERRAIGVSLFVASAPAGAAIAQFAGPPLVTVLDAPGVFASYALITVVGLVVVALSVRQPVRPDDRLSLSQFGSLVGDRAILLASVSSFCTYALFVFFNSWMPTYATEVLSTDLATAGTLSALVPVLGLAARPGGGLLSEWLDTRIRTVVVAAFAIALVPLFTLRLIGTLPPFAVLLVLAGIGSQLGMGALLLYVTQVTSADTRGSGVAVLTTLSIAGALVAPLAGGWLVQSVSWNAAFGAGVGLALLGTLSVLVAPHPASRRPK